MGEIAEMMLDGTLCEGCGEVIIDEGEEPQGYPGYCSKECAADRGATFDGTVVEPPDDQSARVKCPECGRRCKSEQGVRDHRRAKHRGAP